MSHNSFKIRYVVYSVDASIWEMILNSVSNFVQTKLDEIEFGLTEF